MIFYQSKTARIFISILLICTCFLMAGCLRAEAHRELPVESSDQTTEPPAPEVDDRPRVALTFDDGPHNIRTKLIVDELDKYGYHATFFVVGNRVDGTAYNGGSAMVYAAEHGNEIGIHGYTHNVYYDECSDAEYECEITSTLHAIQSKIPEYEVQVMRPIGGGISSERAAESPYAVVKWNVDTLDWNLAYPEKDAEGINTIVENALANIEDGDIILMHDIYNNTYEATVIILKRLDEMGYNVVTVSELLGDDLYPGEIYTKAP